MQLKQLLAVFAVFAVALSGAVAPAVATENNEFNNSAVDTVDATNTTYINAENPELDNVTVQFSSETWTITSDGSIEFNVAGNMSAASASASGTDVSASVQDDGDVLVEDSTSDSTDATLDSLDVTFNVSTDESADGIYAGADAADPDADLLIEDPDSSVQHDYNVLQFRNVVSVDYNATNGEIEDGSYTPDTVGEQTNLTVDITRNSNYSHVPLEALGLSFAFDTGDVSDLSDATDTSQNITYQTMTEAGSVQEYEYTVDDASEMNESYTFEYTFTPETGSATNVITVGDSPNPEGGLQSEDTRSIDFGTEGFLNVFGGEKLFSIAGIAGIIAIVGVIGSTAYYMLGRPKTLRNGAGLLPAPAPVAALTAVIGIASVTMAVDVLLGSGGMMGDFWVNFVSMGGVFDFVDFAGSDTPAYIAAALAVAYGGLQDVGSPMGWL
ncbi:hypothetical protein [Haloglomus salinum]|uniref:hypothetical protein n=1 Tax=Haloglomus salinum TaxID=2962673 RepID=UPI0020C99E58|nr:hypothetical protein [Haloglomus salinum]